MARRRPFRPLREWTEDCRVHRHAECRHIDTTRTVGLLGVRRFLRVCSCPCHWGCPAEATEPAEPSASASACTCDQNGPARQRFFDKAARSAGRRPSDTDDR